MPEKYFEFPKKIYLADTDVTGIAYYARHLEWLEMARVEFIAAIYKPLTKLIAEDQISFMPISVQIDYKAPALFEDNLLIKLKVKGMDKLRLVLAYQVVKMVGEKEVMVSTAEVVMVCIDLARGNRPTKIPVYLLEIFTEWQ